MPSRRRRACFSSKTKSLIQMLAIEYLEECGLKVDTAGSAAEAMNKLRLIPGGVDALVIDMGLPDRSGDVLVREMRSIYPSSPSSSPAARAKTSCGKFLRTWLPSLLSTNRTLRKN